jgi:hypothetical protein
MLPAKRAGSKLTYLVLEILIELCRGRLWVVVQKGFEVSMLADGSPSGQLWVVNFEISMSTLADEARRRRMMLSAAFVLGGNFVWATLTQQLILQQSNKNLP